MAILVARARVAYVLLIVCHILALLLGTAVFGRAGSILFSFH